MLSKLQVQDLFKMDYTIIKKLKIFDTLLYAVGLFQDEPPPIIETGVSLTINSTTEVKKWLPKNLFPQKSSLEKKKKGFVCPEEKASIYWF